MMTILTIVQPLFIGTTELLLIGGMALLLFGGKKLPEMMRGLGQGMKEFKKGMAMEETDAQDSPEEKKREEANGNVVRESASENDVETKKGQEGGGRK